MLTSFKKTFNFFRRQSENFKILLIQGLLAGGGMRQGAINALTRQYTNLYIVALGATKVQLGLIQSITTAGRIALSIPIGQVIDRVNLKKIFLLGMIFSFLSPLVYALAVDWYMVIPAVLFLSISGAGMWTNLVSGNNKIVMVHSGHILDVRHSLPEGGTNNGGVAHSVKVDTYGNGNKCNQIVVNHQNDAVLDNNITGNASATALVFYEFNSTNKTIRAYDRVIELEVSSSTFGNYPTSPPDWESRTDYNLTY